MIYFLIDDFSGAGTDSEKKITFTPDYSVTIQDDCTYLEISAQTYLLAYKTTLLSRESKFVDNLKHT